MLKPAKNLRILILSLFLTNSLLLNPAYTQAVLLPPDYLGLIQQKINSYSVYPVSARLKGWEGIAKVRFTLAQDGRIKEIDIAQSSGYPLLDAAAMLAIKDASPYPFPKGYSGEEIELTLPVNYAQPKTIPVAKPISQEALILPQEPAEGTPASAEELNQFIDLSLTNNPPVKVAQQEVELANLKITEAQRGFFPGVKLQGYSTDGEVFKVDYEEREVKAQFDQPIYYSGRLTDTLRQSRVNLEITQKNYDRLKLDVVQKTETAYYNLVASKMHLMEKQALRKEAKEVLGKIERLEAGGMIIPLEVNSARSWYEQIESQIKSIEHDLYMAELTFKQVLNTTETPQVESGVLEQKHLNLNLDNCVEIAFDNRPEMYLSELLVRFNDYGKKIEASKGQFAVDLTTSLGKYQGHFKTEPWNDSTNWYLGFKVSKPWGGSTLNSSYTKEKTQPRFGQTSPTESSTLSAEFNLLDNMKRLYDKKKAEIDFSRSSSDFNETLKTVIFEVQDAFLKYEKAGFQLNTAQAEMKFRRNEAEVTKVRAMVGESSHSSALEALYAFSESQSRYIQAIANYYISLANLKKATGYGLKV